MSHEEAYAHWSRLHGGLDPRTSFWVAGWVRLSHACARPLAQRGVRPDTVTIAGVLVTAVAAAIASLGGAWPLLAVVVLVGAGVLDGVDGALAAQSDAESRWGRVLDPLADRVADLLALLALVALAGFSVPAVALGAAAGALTLLLESVRSSAQVAGMTGPGAVTLWERPSRVIVAACGFLACGVAWLARRGGVDLLPAVDAAALATTALAVAATLAVAGLVRLLVAVRHALRARPR